MSELLRYYSVPPEAAMVVPAYTPIPPEERKRRVAELNDKVKENVVRLQKSAEFRNFLIAMSHFHNYSWGNQMLIWLQKPDARHVAGYNTWRDLGRYVKKGESGIAILAPLGPTSAITWIRATDNAIYAIKRSEKGWAIYDNDENLIEDGFPTYSAAARRLKEMGFVEKKQTLNVNNFKIVHIFDITQTEGKPLPEFEVPQLTTGMNQTLFDGLMDIAKAESVTVSFDPELSKTTRAEGYFQRPKFIWIRPENPPATQLNTLLHEFSHYFTEEVFSIPHKDAETIAECSACVVGAYYGFDTGTASFPYVAIWAKEEKTLYENMKSIQEVAEKIIDRLEERKTQLIPMTARKKEKPKVINVEEAEAKYSLAELQKKAREAGINPFGASKRDLCRALIRLGAL
jgi:hypothetical protein